MVIITIPSTPGSFKWSLSLRFPHQYPVYTSPPPYTCNRCIEVKSTLAIRAVVSCPCEIMPSFPMFYLVNAATPQHSPHHTIMSMNSSGSFIIFDSTQCLRSVNILAVSASTVHYTYTTGTPHVHASTLSA